MPDLASVCLTLFVVGLLGGGHCIGMCGGIVSALSLGQQPARRGGRMSLLLAYNGGRLLSYTLAGALAGVVGAASLWVVKEQWLVRVVLYGFANLMLLGMGLYLMGLPAFLAPIERAGQGLWQRLQPLGRRWLPIHRASQAFPLGVLWGWLPCGLVYSALATALMAGSAPKGAAVMLAFGLGTLPNLILAGFLAERLQTWIRRPGIRWAAGMLIIGFSLYGFLGIWKLAQNIRF